MRSTPILVIALVLATSSTASAQGALGKALGEAGEYAAKRLGREVAKEGSERLAGQIAAAVARHGDDAIHAVNRVGPSALKLADDAGEQAPNVLRLLSRHGDDAARVLSDPKGMAIFTRFGDEAAEILIAHRGVAAPLVEELGVPAVKALKSVGPQNARRLAMLSQGGDLSAIGRTDELLDVIARSGDKACDFIYRHRAVLAGSAALTAFLANPEPFLNGTKDLAQVAVDGTNELAATVAESAVKPAVVAVGRAAGQVINVTAWTLAFMAIAATVAMGLGLKRGLHRNPAVIAFAHAVRHRSAETLSAWRQRDTAGKRV